LLIDEGIFIQFNIVVCCVPKFGFIAVVVSMSSYSLNKNVRKEVYEISIIYISFKVDF